MRADSGFTLLEVMGAVVILGIIGVSLITTSMDSSLHAAQARDRLAASLLADSTLADVEARAKLGGLAPGTQRDTDADGFEIEVAVQPADLATLAGGNLDADEATGPSLLTSGRGRAPVLLQVHVTVTDPAGGKAERVSFAFDPSASEELQALAPLDESVPVQ